MNILIIILATIVSWSILWIYGEFKYVDGAVDQYNGDIKIEDLIE